MKKHIVILYILALLSLGSVAGSVAYYVTKIHPIVEESRSTCGQFVDCSTDDSQILVRRGCE